MYRKYKGNFEANKVVQILNDNTVCKLPLIKAGANVLAIGQAWTDAKYKSMGKFKDYLIVCVDSTLYIYNSNIVLVEKIKLDEDVKHVANNYIHIVDLEDQCLIVYGKGSLLNGSVVCKLLSIKNDRLILSEESNLISGEFVSSYLATCKLANDKIIVGYYKDNPIQGNSPFLSVISIEDNKVIISKPTELLGTGKTTWKQNLYLTKIDDTTFLYTYTIKTSNAKGNVTSTILELDLQNNIIQSDKAFDIYCCWDNRDKIAYTITPLFVKDNLIAHFDYDKVNSKSLITLKEIIKKDDSFIVRDVINININSATKSMNYLMNLKKENNVVEIVAACNLNKYLYLIRLDFNTNKFEYIITYDIENSNLNSMTSLENNKIATMDKDNNLCIVKIANIGGNIIGLVKENDIVCTNGLCELKNINLEIGKKYYFNSDGDLTADEENNTFIGYSIDTNKLIVFPNYSKQNTITKSYKGNATENKVVQILVDNTIKDLPVTAGHIIGLHIKDGQVIIQGSAKVKLELVAGQKYYFDTNGDLTLDNKNSFLGYAVSSNMLYIPKFLG